MAKNIHRVWYDFSGLKYFACDQLLQQSQISHAILSSDTCKDDMKGKLKRLGILTTKSTAIIIILFSCGILLTCFLFFSPFNTTADLRKWSEFTPKHWGP